MGEYSAKSLALLLATKGLTVSFKRCKVLARQSEGNEGLFLWVRFTFCLLDPAIPILKISI